MKKIIYCLETTGIAGGHRVVFEHMNLLAARGWEVELFCQARPTWHTINVPITICTSYSAMQEALDKEGDVIKVATWWKTANPVFDSCKKGGGTPVYFVQDIETSYYEKLDPMAQIVLKTYKKDFKYLTTSDWNVKQLTKMGLESVKVNPAINHNVFKQDPVMVRQDNQVLSLARNHPLKNMAMLLKAIDELGTKNLDFTFFGIDHKSPSIHARFVYGPPDGQVARMYSEATIFVSTSKHEGFCLPILEAMACGAVVITTNSDGNMDFCVKNVNCVMVEQDNSEQLAKKIVALIGDKEKRSFLQAEGYETAKRYNYARMGEELNNFYKSLCPK